MGERLKPSDRHIVWRDTNGVLHLVEGADIHPGVRLLRPRCGKGDVPANQAWLRNGEPIECPKCREIEHDMGKNRTRYSMNGLTANARPLLCGTWTSRSIDSVDWSMMGGQGSVSALQRSISWCCLNYGKNEWTKLGTNLP